MAVLLVSSWFAGSLVERTEPGLASAPVSIQVLVPLFKLTGDLLALATVGMLLIAGFLLTAPGERLSPSARKTARATSAAAAAWLVVTVVSAAVTLSDVFALPVADVLDPSILASFLRQTTLGTTFLWQMVGAAVVAILAPLAVRRWHVGALLCVAVGAISLRGTTGHSGITGDHETAGILLGLHVAAVSVWVGGLVALVAVVLGRVTADARAFRSFSAIALWSATVVAVTGISQLLLRVTDANELFTSAYGLIMVAKMQLLALLLAIGWVQRSRTLPMLEMGNRRPLVALAGLEALIMAAVVGLSVTLSRTAAASHVADGLTSGHSHALPPVPLNPIHFLSQWRVDVLAVVLAALLVAAYAEGLYALHRRGTRWPTWRTVSFSCGVATLLLAGCSGIGTYSVVLAIATLIHGVSLLLVVPTLLILGRPITLLVVSAEPDRLRAAWFRVLLGLRRMAVERASTNPGIPVVVALSMVITIGGTQLLPNALWPFWGRLAIDVALLIVGSWVCAVVIHVAQGRGRLRLLPAATLAGGIIALFAIVIAVPTVLHAQYFGYFLPPYTTDLLTTQRLGAGICIVITSGWFLLVVLATSQRLVAPERRQRVHSSS